MIQYTLFSLLPQEDQPQTKRCCRGEKCLNPDGPDLPLSEFGKSKRYEDGLYIECKFCHSIHAGWKPRFPDKSLSELVAMQLESRNRPRVLKAKQVCANGSDCKNPNGPNLTKGDFYGLSLKSESPVCIDCTKYKTSLVKNRVRVACIRGDECIDPNGPNLGPDSFYKDQPSACKTCFAFEGWARTKGLAHLLKSNREEALLLYRNREKKSLDLPNGILRCSKREKCVHPDGPILPVSEFDFCKRNKSGYDNNCSLCDSFSRFMHSHPHLEYEDARQLFLMWKLPPEGYYFCYSEFDCLTPGGPLLKKDLFWEHPNPKGIGRCAECSKFRRWAGNRNLPLDEAFPLYQKWRAYRDFSKEGFAVCSKQDKCVNPDGPILPLDAFSVHAGRRYSCCKRCERKKSSEYRRANYAKFAERQRKRVKRLGELPSMFSREDFDFALDYWEESCAYCGDTLGESFHMDHHIPIRYKGDDNPGTVPWNMLPACQPCNSRKQGSMPDIWVVKMFGEEKAKAILKKIHAFFSVVRSAEAKVE